jgi:hypothetical protein
MQRSVSWFWKHWCFRVKDTEQIKCCPSLSGGIGWFFFFQDVRSSADRDFSFNITYREFTAEMIQELISHSLYCSQKIKYDCYKAPLELHSATWFLSSMESDIIDYLGNMKRGTCPCAGTQLCSPKCRVWCEHLFWIHCFMFHFSCCCWFLLIADKITLFYH